MIDYMQIISTESNNIGFGMGEFQMTLEQEREVIRKYSESDNSVFLVGYIDEELVSLGNLSSSARPRMRHSADLGMSVLKKYWRKGIGQAMMHALIDWAKGSGILRKINLEVTTYNTGGIALYKKMGFVTQGTISRRMLIDGEFVTTYHMGLELD